MPPKVKNKTLVTTFTIDEDIKLILENIFKELKDIKEENTLFRAEVTFLSAELLNKP